MARPDGPAPAGAAGDFSISPASSIHRDREGHSQHRDPRNSFQHEHDQDTPPVGADIPGTAISGRAAGSTAASPLDDGQWDFYGDLDTSPNGDPWQDTTANDRPETPQRPVSGDLVQQELAEARARAALPGRGPSVTSYGPAPGDEIEPVPRVRGRNVPQARSPHEGQGPFMHYEDIAYLDSENDPKDELEMGGLSRNETFPAIPEGANNRARRSWDRQRNRRMKKPQNPRGTTGAAPLERGGFGKHLVAWTPEILWSLLSILSLGLIIAVLTIYNQRGLPNWPLPISLNTLVAFLEAICRVSLIVPLTEGLAQLKWNTFARGERALSDFGVFDDAGRGPVGNARFIFKRKGRVMGLSAALGLLTVFATSPLTQAAITYPTRFVAGTGTALAPRSELYSHPEYLTTSGRCHRGRAGD